MKNKVMSHPDVIRDPTKWEVDHHFADKLYAKQIMLPAGSEVIQHAHDYDHLSIFSGVIELTVGDKVSTLSAPDPKCLVIKKGENHGIRAITDVTWFCIHNEDVALWPSSQE